MAKAIRWSPEQLAQYESRTTPNRDRRPMHAAVAPAVLGPENGPEAGEPRNKFGNRKVEIDGVKFDSEKEYRRWLDLQLLQKAGEICDLQRQVRFVLAPAVELDGKTKPELRYWADFTYRRGRDASGPLVVEDCKSEPTRKKDTYRIKKHLMKSVHDIEILES